MSQGLRNPKAAWFLAACLGWTSWAGEDLEVVSKDGIDFVRIPAGSFLMGTTDYDRDELIKLEAWTRFQECERPAHPVTISHPFFMSHYEITQREWKEVMGNNPAAFKGLDRPVESVSWNDVQQFIQKLNGKSSSRYRLPTEAEWEYCCRAESTNLFGYGKNYETLSPKHIACYAWYRADAENQTHSVGEKKSNAWGLFDMHGNVWEWCQDWYAADYYAKSASVDPLNKEPSTERVFRGGSWFLDWGNQRAAFRSANLPDFRSQYVGFRLVCEIEGSDQFRSSSLVSTNGP